MAVRINPKLLIILSLLIVLCTASFFRLWQLKAIPDGLFPDEAANGLDIVYSIFQGDHSPFFERGLGRESLFFYLQAVSTKIFGIGPWQMHLVSALIGIFTVLFIWLLARKLFNSRIAFFAGLLSATSSWHVTLSRTGFRAILVPLFSTAFFYFSYCAYKENPGKKKIVFSILSGTSLALGLYSYPSFRLISLIMGVLFTVILLVDWKIIKNNIKTIILALAAFLLIVAPLTVYFANHIDSFFGRAGYVSIFNKEQNQGDLLGTFLFVAQKTFWMFFTDGDLNWRHNTSGKSMLSPIASFFFAAGFLYSVFIVLFYLFKRKFFQSEHLGNYFKHLFLIFWFLIMIIPEILTAEGIPHGLRAIGVIPAAFILSALGINLLYEKSKRYLNSKIIFGIVLLVLSANAFYDYYLYFGISANSPEFHYAYRSDLTQVSAYLNQRSLKEKTYLVSDPYSVQTPEFLTYQNHQPYILVDPATCSKTQLKTGDQIVFTQSTIFDTKKFMQYHPNAKLVKQKFNRFGEEIMRVYEY